ncbi:ArgE/DapE family deacylase [Loigolactobacillus binensis]|uniref:Probable succinyl-diaminopimelate desuccinylase n=1 Tax=Loigolactobacillus binensis TaxID=2559922 RepID=A0ABW3EEB1_9LACO|nr:ArgE/DapE family deacylase [Loigolactobacillus binensis]
MDKRKALKILQDLLKIKSVNNHEAQVADYIKLLFDDYPAAQVTVVNYAPGRSNLVITIHGDQSGKTLGLAGHLDVVSPGDVSAWRHPPFAGEMDADNVYGRGASDMKGGLAALIYVLLDLLAEKRVFTGSIRLFATIGEETGNYGAAQLTRQGFADELDALIVGEPSQLQVEYTHRGVIDYELAAEGKAAHSANPEAGNNAIDQLFRFYTAITQLMASKTKIDPVLGSLLHNVTQIVGGEQINSIPARARLYGNIRTTPLYPNQPLMAEVTDLVAQLNQQPENNLTLTYHYPESPLPGNAQAPFVQLFRRVASHTLGQQVAVVGDSGATDASEFIRAAQKFPVVIFGPGNNSSHQVDEYVAIKDYLAAITIYQQVILQFLR